jgi:hypothetical protein
VVNAAVERAAAIVAAINERDPERFAALVGEDAEVRTGRRVLSGADLVAKWASKEYDHLVKRYAIDEYRADGETVLALGSVQYVWSESGDVGDSSPIALRIELAGEQLRSLEVHDDTAAALAAFEA